MSTDISTTSKRVQYTEEQIGESLMEAADILGHSPSIREYDELGLSPSGRTIQLKYGSWNSAKSHFGLDTEPSNREKLPSYKEHADGYLWWKHYDGDEYQYVLEHRLLATLLVEDIEDLEGKHVHHANGVKFHNTLDNIEILTPQEHADRHSAKQQD